MATNYNETFAVQKKPILVIRPLRHGDAFLQLLEDARLPFCHIPVMQIEPVDKAEPEYTETAEVIAKLDRWDHAIFISANAAEIGLALIAKHWPVLPAGLQFYAVGQQTAELFAEYDYPVRCPIQQPNTEGLLSEIQPLQSLDGQSVVIFRGGEGRQTLGAELAARGGLVRYCELYRRIIDPSKVAEARAGMQTASCLVAHSGELLRALGDCVDRQLPVVVPSARIAQQARQLGYNNIEVADNALPQSMFNAIQCFI
jgi:uroporphyrinogen-III synthase